MMRQVIFTFFLFFSFSITAQSVWTKKDLSQFRNDVDEELKFILPQKFESYNLDFKAIAKSMTNASELHGDKSRQIETLVELPNEHGKLETFQIYDAPVMAPGLASKYPNIRSYKGVSTTQKSKNVRIDIGPYGLHAAIHSPQSVVYIDPYIKGQTDEYLVYNVKDYEAVVDIGVPTCGVDHGSSSSVRPGENILTRSMMETVEMKEYRIAIACTGEWGALRGNVENALADMVTGVNRMNQIFENEAALRIILIDDNDKLIHLDPATDPYNVVNSGANMLSVNTSILNTIVGNGAYDVGHVYARNCDVGGIAALGSWCNNANKGAGVTCHFNGNIDYIAANTTSHELGHMMTAQHTFNNCGGPSDTNTSPGNGYEPGSGTTIMSYAGACGSNNVAGDGHTNYHVASLIQIYNHTQGDGPAYDCAVKIETSNVAPVIDLAYGDDIYIPTETTFFLKGYATDENNDDMTYSWEQFNTGPISPLGSPTLDSPRFRVFPPNPNPTRYFPSTDNVLNFLFDRTEILPTATQTMDFMFVVRDNNLEAGITVWDRIKVNAVKTDEKFGITSQSDVGQSFEGGQELEVKWNVAGTDQAPFNARNVDILLNTSLSADFDIETMEVLAEGVPNNGSAFVNLPNKATTTGRIVVRASDKIFFSVSRFNFEIVEQQDPGLFMTNSPSAVNACLPAMETVEISTEALNGLEGDVQLSIANEPDGLTINIQNETLAIGESTTLTITSDETVSTGSYEFEVVGTVNGDVSFTKRIAIYTINNDHSAMSIVQPENGITSNAAPTFEWTASENALVYDIEIATSPTFNETTVFAEYNYTGTTYPSPEVLDIGTLFYWRVTPKNACNDGKPILGSFSTEVLSCVTFAPEEGDLPINISQSGSPTIEVPIEVNAGTIVDVNVTRFIGEHDNNKDLSVRLIAPSGTSARMFHKICNQSDFNTTFDQESNIPVKCPLNAPAVTYRPKDDFSVFNDESADGTWLVRVEDTQSGNGGKLIDVNIEICAGLSVTNPLLVRNETLEMSWGGNRVINSNLLRVEDEDNNLWETIYTLVTRPVLGSLLFDGNEINVGETFTQKDINDGKLTYTSAEENYLDGFSFTVIDGDGGFIGITDFNITVDESTSVDEKEIAAKINVFPIPTKDVLTIDLSTADKKFTSMTITNINGQKMMTKDINNSILNVDVSQLPTGIYILNIQNENYSIPKKIVIE